MTYAPSRTLIDMTGRLRSELLARPVHETTLQQAVCAYVDEAKQLGWPVERMIIELKHIAESEESPRYHPDPFERAEGQRKVERVVTWCVEHYYR